ncbi:MAG: SDR family NAD(P)-dependent oxidoreductase [Chloroflexi bacterium]|nr:SDR family NAD(P)-dependent oxidoreductase [Chloroflexota bacterium]
MADREFEGQVAIITGASRGIGRAITLALAERGATVVVSARRLESSAGTGGTLAETAAMAEALGAKALAVAAEIVNEQGPQYIVQQAIKAFGRVDMLVNNAGVYPDSKIVEMDLREWRDMLAINLTAPFLMSKAVIPQMTEQGSGNILNISSGYALTYAEGRVGYGDDQGWVEHVLAVPGGGTSASRDRGERVDAGVDLDRPVWAPGRGRVDGGAVGDVDVGADGGNVHGAGGAPPRFRPVVGPEGLVLVGLRRGARRCFEYGLARGG